MDGSTPTRVSRLAKNPLRILYTAKSGPFCFMFERSSEKTFFAFFLLSTRQNFCVAFVSLRRYFPFEAQRKHTFLLQRKNSQNLASLFSLRFKIGFFVFCLILFRFETKKLFFRFKRKYLLTLLYIFVSLPNRYFRRVVAIITV